MKKPAAILSLLLSAALLIAFAAMSYSDGKNAADRVDTYYSQASAGMSNANAQDHADWQDRQTEEREYGFGGLVALIAGFALWPRSEKVAKVSAIEQLSTNA